MHYIKTELFD